MFLHNTLLRNTLRRKGLNLLLLAASVMLLMGLTSCFNDDPVAPEVVVADVANVDALLGASSIWQGFSPVLNRSEEGAGQIANIERLVGDTNYGKGANPIVNGRGTWEIDMGTVGFQVSVVELPDGTFNGHGVSTLHTENGNAWFHFDVVEAAPFGDEIAVLGLITDAVNSPPNFVGSKTALIIMDNQRNGSDTALSAAGLPPFLSLDNILYGPNPPPPFRFTLTHGNYKMH
jgi:hypothetical protein